MANDGLRFDFGNGVEELIPVIQEGVGPVNESQPHYIIVLVADKSLSMITVDPETGEKRIQLVNKGLNSLISTDKLTEFYKNNVDVAVVSFNDKLYIEQDFTPMSIAEPNFELDASGTTCLYQALIVACEMARKRKNELSKSGIPTFRPLVLGYTDGKPEGDDFEEECRAVLKDRVDSEKTDLIIVGFDQCDMALMDSLCEKVQLIKLSGADGIEQVFDMLSDTLVKASQSDVNDAIHVALDKFDKMGVQVIDGKRQIKLNETNTNDYNLN